MSHFLAHLLIALTGLGYSLPPEHAQDSRVVTECWLERCIHDEKVLPPGNQILSRPLTFPVPIMGASCVLSRSDKQDLTPWVHAGAEKIKAHVTGYSGLDKMLLARLVVAMGELRLSSTSLKQ